MMKGELKQRLSAMPFPLKPVGRALLMAVLLCVALRATAQISPGKLSEAHAHLEGVSNCTQCHDLGNKVPDNKCLACHEEIEELIRAGRGYHASREVQSKTCVRCHNEHHGRKFQMIRFDEDAFDHDLANYELEGKHATIDCRSCHKPDYISNADLKKRSNTFLGLSDRCLNCHEDYHQKTLGNDCAKCHGFDDFAPADYFDHDETKYALKGAHQEVECKKCHPMTTRRGKKFQQFAGIEFADCITCHEDPHEDRIPGKCTQCHKESAFSDFIGRKRFRHEKTGFVLKGRHASISCFSCHKRHREAEDIFDDHFGLVSEKDCAKCHEDVHEGKFGKDCAKCHREKSFHSLRKMDFFDHSVTDFPLEGNHMDVKCKACHKRGHYTDPIDFSRCDNCHDDYHEGVFKTQTKDPDCGACHRVDKAFSFSAFGIEEHKQASFALEGAHIAVPCFSCHLQGERWVFKDLGVRCIDCHEDIHKGFINAKFYPDNDCTRCHQPDSWQEVSFDHQYTDWPLEGRHADLRCGACHFSEEENGSVKKQRFKNLDTHCQSCHDNVHGDQFAERQQMEGCAVCHTPDDWFPYNFDHNSTAFPLDGQHEKLECGACHYKTPAQDIIIYKNRKTKCIDCHS